MRIFVTFCVLLVTAASAQDSSLASLRVIVSDPTNARVAHAEVRITSVSTNAQRTVATDPRGAAAFANLEPGRFAIEIIAPGFAPGKRELALAVGEQSELSVSLTVGAATDTVIVREDTAVQVLPTGPSTVITEKQIEELPLNGRRFADLALLDTNAVSDPRSLTSASNGDLAFGGIRGYNTSTIVDGMDNNNGFFAQSRGRLRAPFQFSNETIKEFRVSTNTFGVEQGRAAGAVVNVVTKSGTNTLHGDVFYYLRDGRFAATHPFVRKKYPDKQHQFGFTLRGPIKPDKVFYVIGFDQHVFHVPAVVQFLNKTSTVTATPADYETSGFAADQALVTGKAAQLSQLGGQFRSVLNGSAGYAKVDVQISARHKLTSRISTSRYYGANNVFFDASSPITNFAISGNGEENVTTTTSTTSLTSTLGARWSSFARVQFARDEQASHANSADVATRIEGIIRGFGRSSILPRNTNEKRWQWAETVSWEQSQHSLKFGADVHFTRIDNYFPAQAGGFYIFDTIKVNPFTFVPQLAGLPLTPLRAYAHNVPRYYIQDFGAATSHPDTNEYATFIQDTMRFGNHFSLSLGVRYDLQTYRQPPLPASPLWPEARKMPSDTNNIAPRVGIAGSFGDPSDPFVVRGGFGIFYPRIPQIYNSTVETQDGTRTHLFLDNSNSTQRPFFPKYPSPLVNCPPGSAACAAPTSVASFLQTNVSTFAKDFQNPYVQQASLSLEKRILPRTRMTVSYLFVGGRHLLRARDVNLPQPTVLSYPVFNEDGTTFSGDIAQVASFAPCCFTDPLRPNPKLGAVNVFETAARSTYHGLTVSADRSLGRTFSMRLGYTWAKAIDDTQDALVAGRPSSIENPFNLARERALSVTDQRQRFVSSLTAEPDPFGRDHEWLSRWFNDWRFSGIFSAGTGRPLSGYVAGDPNRDHSDISDRLPGAGRNSFAGPDYFSGSARVTRRFHLTEQWRLEATAEAFNVFNHDNQRVDSSEDGFTSTAASFVTGNTTAGGKTYPARITKAKGFLQPTDAYSPRQVQFALRLKW